MKSQTCYLDKWWIPHTWEHSGYLHPYPTHPPSSIITLDLSSGLERAWLKMAIIFPLLIQTWRAKDKDANELTILMSFQKENWRQRKNITTKMQGFFWSCSFLSRWYWLLPVLLPCIQAAEDMGWFCLASVAGQAGNLDTESTERGWNKQNGPVIMVGTLPKNRSLPVPCGPTEIYEACVPQTAVTAWLSTARQPFTRPLRSLKYSQLGIDSVGFFFKMQKAGFRIGT